MRTPGYALAMLGIGAILCALVAVSNFVTDPLDRLGLTGDERVLKPWIVTHVPHEGIIIGSSKTDYANPDDVSGIKLVNASFSAALPEEIRAFVERYVRPGQIVLLGVDPFMFNEQQHPRASGTIVGPGDMPSLTVLLDRAKYVFSFDVLQTALERLLSNSGKGSSPYLANGARYVPFEMPGGDWRGNFNRILQNLRRGNYDDFVYSESRVRDLAALKAFAEKHDICLKAFINPLHEAEADLLAGLPAQSAFLRFRADMHRVFPEIVDFTVLPYSASALYFRDDPFHYLPSTGAQIIRYVLTRPSTSPPCVTWKHWIATDGSGHNSSTAGIKR